MVPPTRPVPFPKMVTACSLALEPGSSSFSLAVRQLFQRACSWRLSIRVPFCARRFGDHVSQGQVDVIAAEQDVFTHGYAAERQLAAAFGDRDEGEVGSPAADIHHQNKVATATRWRQSAWRSTQA